MNNEELKKFIEKFNWEKFVMPILGRISYPNYDLIEIIKNPCIVQPQRHVNREQYGHDFVVNHDAGSKIGHWPTKKEPQFRRRWTGGKYVYEKVND